MENNNTLPQISNAQINAAKILSQSDIASSLMWEMCYNITEFSDPLPFDFEFPCNKNNNLRDIVFAQIDTLGHYDKYPHAYDWQQLLQTLNDNEELLWIISKKSNEKKFTTYVALKFNKDDIGSLEQLRFRREQFQIFSDNFSRRRFPESVIERIHEGEETKVLLSQLRHEGTKFAVIGMPSLKELDPEKILTERNEEKRSYASLNDILEPYINIESAFTIIFSVSPCTTTDVSSSFQKKFELRNLLKPFLEQEINHTEGKSWGTGLNITPENTTFNTSATPKKNIFKSLGRALCGSRSKGGTQRLQETRELMKGQISEQKWNDMDVTNSVTITPAQQTSSSHQDKNISDSQTIHVTHSDLVFLDSVLEQSIKHLQQAIGGNGFHTSAVVYSENENTGKSVARAIRATLSGSQNYLRPMQIIPLQNETFFQLDYNCTMADILKNCGLELEVMNSERASFALPVPDADIPGGMNLKKSVFYSKPEESKIRSQFENDEIELHTEVKSNDILLGRVAYYENQLEYQDLEEYNYTIPHNDIFSHAFISGAPGGGKSKRTAFILNHLPSDIRLVVLETAKKEYGDTLHRTGKKLLRYTLGNSQIFPLRINPFFFDPGTNLKQHISVISDALTDLLPVEALIGPKMRKAVENCYIRCEWDIETSTYLGKAAYPVYPDMLMFNSEIQDICKSFAEYGAEVRGNYTGALKNRAAIFLDEIYQDIFAFDGNKTIDQLFPPNTDVVIEMEDMPPSEMNMPAFILTILMHRLRSYRFLQSEYDEHRPYDQKSHKFVIAIEEAHNVLSRDIEVSTGGQQQTGKGKALLSLIKKTLAEGRGIGMGLIIVDQSAHAIAPSVLANTNMKIIFRQKDGEEVDTLGKAIGLSDEDRQDLQYLGTGECAISTVDNPKPFKLAKLSFDEIADLENFAHAENDIVLLSDKLRQPPYYLGKKFLDAWCANGLSSYKNTMEQAKVFYDICNSQYAIARYILGKYILDKSLEQPKLYLLLKHYLEVNSITWKNRIENIADAMFKIMNGQKADLLLNYLDKRINATEFCEQPLDQKYYAFNSLLNALKDDMNSSDKDAVQRLEELFADSGDAVKSAETLEAWKERFWKISVNLKIFEHLNYQNQKPKHKKTISDNQLDDLVAEKMINSVAARFNSWTGSQQKN